MEQVVENRFKTAKTEWDKQFSTVVDAPKRRASRPLPASLKLSLD